ncbi:MAG TPA: extracellular solute-binding protein [Jiangellaceae bacterium]|nr:extracellular solute-binding protein [Jiangellaceae bacterium]
MSVPQFDTEKSPPSRGRRKLAAVVPLAALLVACGSAADESPTDTDTGDGTSDAASGSLVVWDWKSGDSATAAYYEAAREDFAAKHPNVDVEFVAQPFDQYYTLLGTAIQSGQGPDLVMFNAGAQLRSRTDALLPLDNYVGEARERLTGWEGFEADGTTYAVPLTLQGHPIYYNKALYEEAGLDPESPPSTWAELEAHCDTIASGTDASCFALGNQEGFGIEFFMSGYGPGIFDDDQYTGWLEGERDWNAPEVRQIFELWTETADRGWYNDGVNSTTMFNDMFTLFSSGEAAHVIGLISDVGHWADLGEFLGDDLGVMQPPVIVEGVGDTSVPIEGGIGYGVTEWSADPDLAADLVMSLASTGALEAFYQDAGAIASDTTIDTSGADSTVVQQIVEWLPDGEPVLHTALSAETLELMHRLSQQLIAGDVSVDDALEQLAASDAG